MEGVLNYELAYQEALKHFNNDEYAAKLFLNDFALKDEDGNIKIESFNQIKTDFSLETWESTYKDYNDYSVLTTFWRVAKAIASCEATEDLRRTWTKNFFDLLLNFKFTAGGRIYANAGTEWRGATYHNCFSGDTSVPTDNGVFKIKELSGKTVNVLNQEETYVPAQFRSFGNQRLFKVVFENQEVVYTTEDHEWIVVAHNGCRNKVTTRNLLGKNVPLIGNKNVIYYHYSDKFDKMEDYLHGAQCGLIFATGLCGDNKSNFHNNVVDGQIEELKYFPNIDEESVAYLRGFLAGFFAFNGHIDWNGDVILYSNNLDHLLKLKRLCAKIGVPTTHIRPKINYEKDTETEVWGLYFVKKYFKNDPFLILKNKHRNEINTSIKLDEHPSLKVIEVTETDIFEEVYCCNEPTTHTFAITESCILTGNCFVGPRPEYDVDSLDGIFYTLISQAKTLKSEGGWGMNFSFIRPRGSFIGGIGVESPGSVKYMELFDKSSEIITSGSGKKTSNKKAKGKIRKGAMMGILDVWHPDIEEFIMAKQVPGRLDKFNISVNCSDEFMERIIKIHQIDSDIDSMTKNGASSEELAPLIAQRDELDKWDLIFPVTTFENYKKEWDGDIVAWRAKNYPVNVFKTVSAVRLWKSIIESTYNRNDPGVLFLDRANLTHCWNYGLNSHIAATNPCIHGDTLIAVADGRNAVTIRQLAEEGKDVPLYAMNPKNGKIEIKWGRNPRITGYNKELLKITLDDNSEIFVTPNHSFYTMDGRKVEAKDLVPGDSLPRFDKKKNNKGYGWLVNTTLGGFCDMVPEYALRTEWLTSLKGNNNVINIDGEIFVQKKCELTGMPFITPWNRREICYHPYLYKLQTKEYDKKNTETIFNEYIRKNFHKHVMIYKDLKELLGRNPSEEEWKEKCKENNIQNQFGDDVDISDIYSELQEVEEFYNHRVKSVEKIDGFHTVYNITVDDFHTFVLVTGMNDSSMTGIFSSNCGEQALPFGSICTLGSFNLTQFVDIDSGRFDLNKLKKYVKYAVRFLDNVDEISHAPLQEYEESMRFRRRIGLGISGWASSLYLMKVRFASQKALEIQDELMKCFTHSAVEASIDLAIEKGMFRDCDPEKHANAYFWKQIQLPEEMIEKIRKYGIRNSALFSIQPTGNTAIFANMISGGLEPIFGREYIRTVIVSVCPDHLKDKVPNYSIGEFKENEFFKLTKEGTDDVLVYFSPEDNTKYKIDKNRGLTKEVLCEDYAVSVLKSMNQWDPNAEWAVQATDLSVDEHVADMSGFAKWIDSSISKCIHEDTLLNTSIGIIKIKELSDNRTEDSFETIKDKNIFILDKNGNKQRIISHYYGGEKPSYKIVFNNGFELISSENHRLLLLKEGSPKWVRVSDIKEGDIVFYRTNECKIDNVYKDSFPIKIEDSSINYDLPQYMTEDYALFLGMWFSCGYSNRNSIGIIEKDSIGDLIDNLSLKLFGIKPIVIIDKKTGVVDHRIESVELSKYFRKNYGSSDKTKSVPSSILRSNKEVKLNFINGLTLSGYLRSNCLVIYDGYSKNVAICVAMMLQEFGCRYCLESKKIGNIFVNKNSYSVELYLHNKDFENNNCFDFAKIILKNDKEKSYDNQNFLDKIQYKNYDKDLSFVKVVKNKFVGLKKVYDIEVENTNSYLIGGIVSHNTVNVPNDYPFSDFENLYLNAYKTGYLKGITTYRIGTMTSVLSVSSGNENAGCTDNLKRIPKTTAPKRPKSLDCEVYHSTIKGLRYYCVVGLMDNDPYEVFSGINCDSNGEMIIPKSVSVGTVTKVKRGQYVLKCSDTNKEFILTNEHSDPNADALTRMISTALRHGSDTSFVVHQLEKTRGDLQSFAKILARVLKKYIKDGKKVSGLTCESCGQESLVYESGCKICKSCGWSACG